MSIHRIAVISDTHGLLRPEAAEVLQSAEVILHGGDITDQGILDRLCRMARVIVVRGNCDKDWAKHIAEEQFFELYGKKIYMIHNKKRMSMKAKDADIIIYGHSHRYEEKRADGKLWLNPGSCGPRRFGGPATMAVLTIDTETGDVGTERVEIMPETGAGKTEDRTPGMTGGGRTEALASGGLREITEIIIRDLKNGKSVDEIVKKRKINRGLTEQICQIYFTHPGIGAQGVVDKMETAGM